MPSNGFLIFLGNPLTVVVYKAKVEVCLRLDPHPGSLAIAAGPWIPKKFDEEIEETAALPVGLAGVQEIRNYPGHDRLLQGKATVEVEARRCCLGCSFAGVAKLLPPRSEGGQKVFNGHDAYRSWGLGVDGGRRHAERSDFGRSQIC
ncbi:hypothetical protein Rumeso_04412 [Rubellimicrobium mesophilum DSM 19309]|uniref:Uncharacterized protein n=1 Tax=Rubellimicrobium mesophilum DSM 19309 TaxID=442562 RepID=A0A017HI91_9RHOB|nr:hypothetical protein [Rubellimicrobium mesophilum]EYD74041.1 hypothetical protein Rumeso_04412 [Rubellimicrobium mesophilum DSM 19309]